MWTIHEAREVGYMAQGVLQWALGRQEAARAALLAAWELHLQVHPEDAHQEGPCCSEPDILAVYRWHSPARGLTAWGVACEACGWECKVGAWWPEGEVMVEGLLRIGEV